MFVKLTIASKQSIVSNQELKWFLHPLVKVLGKVGLLGIVLKEAEVFSTWVSQHILQSLNFFFPPFPVIYLRTRQVCTYTTLVHIRWKISPLNCNIETFLKIWTFLECLSFFSWWRLDIYTIKTKNFLLGYLMLKRICKYQLKNVVNENSRSLTLIKYSKVSTKRKVRLGI